VTGLVASLARGPFRAFRSRDFSLYWLASVMSILSHFMLFILRGWLALDLTDSPFAVAAVAASGELPSLIFSIPGGILADRMSRKTVLIIGESVNAVTLLAIAALIATGQINIWNLVALGIIAGSAFAVAIPARQAIVPNIVEREYIANGVALSSMMFSGGMLIGPALAGWLLLTGGMSVSFFVAAFISTASVAVFLPVRIHQAKREAGSANIAGVWKDMVEGLVYVRHHATILGLLALMLAVVVFGSPYEAVLSVFARDILNAGEAGLGLLGASGGVGAIVASLIIASLNGPIAMRNYVLFGSIGLGAFVTAFALSEVLVPSMIFALGAGFAFQLVLTAINALIQILVADEVRGRVTAVRSMLWGAAPFGMFVLGGLAEMFGTGIATAVTGIATVIASIVTIAAFSGLRRVHHISMQSQVPDSVAIATPVTES
jgi:predicted MFS family arabinose efflux permease